MNPLFVSSYHQSSSFTDWAMNSSPFLVLCPSVFNIIDLTLTNITPLELSQRLDPVGLEPLLVSVHEVCGASGEEGKFRGENGGNNQIPKLDWNPQWSQLYYRIRGAEVNTVSRFYLISISFLNHDQHDSPFMGDGIVRELNAPYSSDSMRPMLPAPPGGLG